MVLSPDRPRLLLPGLKPPDPFLETYLVRPGGATVLQVREGDRIAIRDRDGGGSVEVTAVAPDGSDDGSALGIAADAPAQAIRWLIGSHADGAPEVIDALAAAGVRPDQARAARLFGEWSPSGASESFLARGNAAVVIAQPLEPSVVEGGAPQSDLIVEVRRTAPRSPDGGAELPPPL